MPASGGESDLWVVVATIVGPIVATALALWGQWWSEQRRRSARSLRVRRTIEREIAANLRTAASTWDRVGTRRSLPALRLEAARKLGRLDLPIWEREAYASLLTELPDAVDDLDMMGLVADHYALLRRMDWSHGQLRSVADGEDVSGDQRLASWAVYADAYESVAANGNPLSADYPSPLRPDMP